MSRIFQKKLVMMCWQAVEEVLEIPSLCGDLGLQQRMEMFDLQLFNSYQVYQNEEHTTRCIKG